MSLFRPFLKFTKRKHLTLPKLKNKAKRNLDAFLWFMLVPSFTNADSSGHWNHPLCNDVFGILTSALWAKGFNNHSDLSPVDTVSMLLVELDMTWFINILFTFLSESIWIFDKKLPFRLFFCCFFYWFLYRHLCLSTPITLLLFLPMSPPLSLLCVPSLPFPVHQAAE